MEINIVNPQMLSILDKTRDLFLENRELCEELSDNLQGGHMKTLPQIGNNMFLKTGCGRPMKKVKSM